MLFVSRFAGLHIIWTSPAPLRIYSETPLKVTIIQGGYQGYLIPNWYTFFFVTPIFWIWLTQSSYKSRKEIHSYNAMGTAKILLSQFPKLKLFLQVFECRTDYFFIYLHSIQFQVAPIAEDYLFSLRNSWLLKCRL